MSKPKSKLSDYALNIPETDYHARKTLSYSILARYEREGGFSSLPKRFDDLWEPTPKTDALLFGSAFDTAVTRGMDAFNKEFVVFDGETPADKARDVIAALVERGIAWEDTSGIVSVMNDLRYYPTWKDVTRISKMSEGGAAAYYRALRKAKDDGLSIISAEMRDMVVHKLDVLRATPLTNSLIFDELPEGQERYFQLQFESNVNDVVYKIMCDMIIVDHNNKSIHIYDLKTSGKESSEFRRSYLDWNYHIQSHLYRMVLLHALMFTDYEDYTVDEFSFIVVSKVNDTPLVWGDDTLVEEERPRLRNPITIGTELMGAYELSPTEPNQLIRKDVPDTVSASSPNSLHF